MKYALLIYDDPAQWADVSEEQMKSIYGEYMAVSELPNTRGGSQLQPAVQCGGGQQRFQSG